MDFEDVRLFTEVVTYQSISEAARKNNLSQQTLSRRIIRLERELGHTLFDRTTPIALTSAGTVFLHHAYIIMANVQKMRREMDGVSSLAGGTVRVKRYATDSFFEVLSDATDRLKKANPNIKVEYVSKNEDDGLLLKEGSIDIGFVRIVDQQGIEPFRYDPELSYIQIKSNSFPLVFGVPEGHPLLTMSDPTLADIAEFRIAMPSFANRGALPNALTSLFRRMKLPLNVDMVYSQSMLEYYSSASEGSVYLFNEMYSVGSIGSRRRRYTAIFPSDGPYMVDGYAIVSASATSPALEEFVEQLKNADCMLIGEHIGV